LSLSPCSEGLSCQHVRVLELLLPHLAGVMVEDAQVMGAGLFIRARARAGTAACPRCGCVSARVHSRYQRRLADAAIGGRKVVIRLAVRRFFCDAPGCPAATFAEQVEGLTSRYARRTPLLAAMLGAVAVAVAGRAGARLARALSVVASRSSLLRLVMALPDPVRPTPRVLGVDDFAIKRGQNYGTVLIDCQSGAPVELLAGREAGPLADWLAAHPGVEVICRDRSGAYAEGARTGAPDAVQVADRFHLWQNLAKAVERCVAAHRGCLPEPDPGPAAGAEPEVSADPAHLPQPELQPAGKFAERARRHHQIVHELLAEGHGIRTIARHLGWGRHTVQRYARAATWQELVDGRWQGPRASKLDPFKPYLYQRTGEGCGNAAQLFREIRGRGYTGSYSIVRNYLDQRRPDKAPLTPPPPTVRDVTAWLTRRPESLTEDEQLPLKALLSRCPELQAASDHVRSFATMLTQLTGDDHLTQWISDVKAAGLPGLSAFAKGLEQDLDAVTQGLTSRWNSGPVEGRVNHIKMIKRQMFGRAGLPLLRKRVLLTAHHG
jgi:transposase